MNESPFLNKLTFTLLILLSLLTSSCFSQYTIVPTGTTTSISELQKKGNLVIVNGANNFFAKCYDGCDQLTPLQPAGPLNYLNAHLNVLDTNLFYISSFLFSAPYHAIVSKTTDGGETWTPILDTLSEEFYTVGLFAFDTNRVVLCSSQGRTFTTDDGGENWEIGPQTGMPIISGRLRINDSTAIIGVLEKLRITTNKGQSWMISGFLQSSPTGFSAPALDSIYVVSYGGTGTFFSYIFGQPQFDRIDENIPMMDPMRINVVSKNEIYITGKGWPQENGRIMKTTDLGETWSYVDIPETDRLLDMVFLNDSIALIGGYDGVLVKWNKNSPMTEWGAGLNENQLVAFASVKPNPATEEQQLEISTVPGETVQVEIVDLQGRKHGLVYSGTSESSSLVVSIDVSQFSSGTYMYSFIAGDRKGHVRFVKQ